ncbi:hypothetical protein [Desulfosporosinus youngiae]|uniref:Uncharacterized protein n=1 Tax=Desulfosporosinus youngiae DSM 17734 TaxID=768710 RepID=H5Y525_9FIRM|nr:hypothetical protein [Desulfosporosinus youngiae]EHQ90129.1 hypothetical protein DesyoDRAFT_3092 [Desulfosporosinus youngiae DSM 17734]
MNRKNFIITTLALTFVLLYSTVAYALITTSYSLIYTGSTMEGYVISSTDEPTVDEIGLRGWFYKDDVLVDQGADSFEPPYAQYDMTASNSFGTQNWRVSGAHSFVVDNIVVKNEVSSTTCQY